MLPWVLVLLWSDCRGRFTIASVGDDDAVIFSSVAAAGVGIARVPAVAMRVDLAVAVGVEAAVNASELGRSGTKKNNIGKIILMYLYYILSINDKMEF